MARDWRTTDKDFRLFQSEAKRCLKAWGLNGWDVDFMHQPLRSGVFAECRTEVVSRHATIALNTRTSSPVDKHRITDAARHEVCHVLVGPIHSLNHAAFKTEDESTQAVESVVNKLNSLLP